MHARQHARTHMHARQNTTACTKAGTRICSTLLASSNVSFCVASACHIRSPQSHAVTVRELDHKRPKVTEELEKTLYGDNIGHNKQLDYNHDWSFVYKKTEKVIPRQSNLYKGGWAGW